jgi:hypothetical protein
MAEAYVRHFTVVAPDWGYRKELTVAAIIAI